MSESELALCVRGSMVCEEIHLSSFIFLLFRKGYGLQSALYLALRELAVLWREV